MGMEYHINERDELITLTATGTVTRADACLCIDKLLKDEAFDASLPQLVDLRTAEPKGEPDDMASFERVLFGDYRPKLSALVAIVVNPDWDEAQCAKAFWISCMLDGAELFDGWNQACKWLIKRDFGAAEAEGLNSSTTASATTLSDLADLSAIDLADDPEDLPASRSETNNTAGAGLPSDSATSQG